ncbi:MAG: hypothetical protein Q7S96_00160 [bacterium]|nr:hypothetical protein [bacterium]
MAELTVEQFETTMDSFAKLVKQGFDAVDDQFREVRFDLSGVKADVAVLKTDVAVLKTDVAELKTDVAVLKTDLAELRADMAEQFTVVHERGDRLATDVDGFTTLHIKLESELSAYRYKQNELRGLCKTPISRQHASFRLRRVSQNLK